MSNPAATTAEPRSFNLPLVTRIVEVLLGGVFLLAAVLKAMDANLFVHQIHLYGVFEDLTMLGMVAVVTLFIETVLGVAMVLGLRLKGLVPASVLAMLLFFTVLIAYAWPEDCGCFGAVKMGPEVSIAKNIVMMFAAGLILYGSRAKADRFPLPSLSASLVVGLVAASYAYPQVFQSSVQVKSNIEVEAAQPTAAPVEAAPAPEAAPTEPSAEAPAATPPGPYAGYILETEFGETLDIGQGEYLVATLSMTCDHCMETVPILNDLMLDPAMPRVVAFALEPEPDSMLQFMSMTGATFPMLNFGNNFLEFSKFMGAAPPRVAFVRNGHVVQQWDQEIPDAAAIREAVLQSQSNSE